MVASAERVSLLRAMNLWPTLTDEELAELADKFEPIEFKKGDVMLQEGENDGHLLVISAGGADVFKKGSEEEQVKLLTLKTGDYAGVGSLIEGNAHSATLIASEDTSALRLSNSTFRSVLQSKPEVTFALLKSLSSELRTFRSHLVHVVTGDSKKIKMAFFDFKPHEKPYFEAQIASFRQHHDIEVSYFPVKLGPSTVSLAHKCKIVCVFVNDDVSAPVLTTLAAQGCQMIALRCAGFNNVDLKAAAALGISVARVPAYSPYAVAEHAASLLMAINRKLPQAYNRFKQANFTLTNLVGFDLHGKTVGVIGTGKIGQCFVKIMLGYGCEVLLYDVYKCKELEELPGCRYVELDEIFQKSRVISLHVPLLPTTKYLVNADTLKKMQNGVIIINTSRGALIKTTALIDALKSGKVGGAGLDVYEEEQQFFFEDRSGDIMKDDVLARLMTFPNVIVTGHQAFLTEEALIAIASVTLGNVGEFLDGKKGKELTNAV